MSTTIIRPQVGKGALKNQQMSPFGFQLAEEHRRQMQAIATYRGWSEAEAMRRAVSLFLRENGDLLQVLTSKSSDE